MVNFVENIFEPGTEIGIIQWLERLTEVQKHVLSF